MRVIYKYTVKNGMTRIPLGAEVIRQDYVNDGFYKGEFVWAIVDSEEETMVPHEFIQDRATLPKGKHVVLGVKEKQDIVCGTPLRAETIGGHVGIRCAEDEPKTHRIAVYKTGQEIDLPNLTYLGLNRIWIVQELGLYTFLVNP